MMENDNFSESEYRLTVKYGIISIIIILLLFFIL